MSAIISLLLSRSVTVLPQLSQQMLPSSSGSYHKDVIRSIETILNSTDEKHQRNFAPMMIDVETRKRRRKKVESLPPYS